MTVEVTAQEHDQQIAKSQAVFHLIAQVMKQLKWASQDISTPGPEAFNRLVRTVQQDTDQLFLGYRAGKSLRSRVASTIHPGGVEPGQKTLRLQGGAPFV